MRRIVPYIIGFSLLVVCASNAFGAEDGQTCILFNGKTVCGESSPAADSQPETPAEAPVISTNNLPDIRTVAEGARYEFCRTRGSGLSAKQTCYLATKTCAHDSPGVKTCDWSVPSDPEASENAQPAPAAVSPVIPPHPYGAWAQQGAVPMYLVVCWQPTLLGGYRRSVYLPYQPPGLINCPEPGFAYSYGPVPYGYSPGVYLRLHFGGHHHHW